MASHESPCRPGLALIVLAFVSLAANAVGQVRYHLTYLGTLGGVVSTSNAINSSGQVVGSAGYAGSAIPHAFLYARGALQDLGVLSGYDSSNAHGINASGQVVGESSNFNGVAIPVLFFILAG